MSETLREPDNADWKGQWFAYFGMVNVYLYTERSPRIYVRCSNLLTTAEAATLITDLTAALAWAQRQQQNNEGAKP